MDNYMYDLVVVVPVYNEEESIGYVIEEWNSILKVHNLNYKFMLLNDDSKDNTEMIIMKLAEKNNSIIVINKKNTGHGQTCIYGYKEAIKLGTEWVLQIDSDGQCDPKYFTEFWNNRNKYDIIFGNRIKRDDGIARKIISNFNRIAVLLSTGSNVLDSNVPYRLMRSKILDKFISSFPNDFYLANILLSIILKKALRGSMKFIDIGFRKRFGGQPSVKWGNFVTRGWNLFISLIKRKKYVVQAVNLINK